MFKVDDAEEEEVMNVRQVKNSEDAASAACGFEGGKAKERYARRVGDGDERQRVTENMMLRCMED